MHRFATILLVSSVLVEQSALGALPPGYEDDMWCPRGYCDRRIVYEPGGFVGPARSFHECFNPSTNHAVGEVWTGSLIDKAAPDGWVKNPEECKEKKVVSSPGDQLNYPDEDPDKSKASGSDDPPSTCKYVRNMYYRPMRGGDGLDPDEALCANKNGGWKYGINTKGLLGLWKPNGKLAATFAKNVDYMYIEDDDTTDAVIYAFGGDDGDIVWELFCSDVENSNNKNIILGMRPRGDNDNILRFSKGEKLATIKKNGKVKYDTRCSFYGGD